MGIGVSLILIAAGAILAFAVHVSGHGFNVHTIGIILLVVGAIGALLSMIFWSSWVASASASRRRSSSASQTPGAASFAERSAGGAATGCNTIFDLSIVVLAASALLALPSAPVRTELQVFTPWAGSIPARGVTIDKTVKGSCTHGSEVETRFDAWHCFVGRRAYDDHHHPSRVRARDQVTRPNRRPSHQLRLRRERRPARPADASANVDGGVRRDGHGDDVSPGCVALRVLVTATL